MKPKRTVLSVSATAVHIISLFVSRPDDIRHYLHGVCFMPAPGGGVLIIATDGHQMAMWHDKKGKCSHKMMFIIPPALVAASKPISKPGEYKDFIFQDGRLVVFDPWGKEIYASTKGLEVEAADGKPDYFKVLPDPKRLVPGLHGGINNLLLTRLAKVSYILSKFPECGSGINGTQYYSSKQKGWTDADGKERDSELGNGPILTRFDLCPELIVISMPIRASAEYQYPMKDPVPAFAIRKEEKAKAA